MGSWGPLGPMRGRSSPPPPTPPCSSACGSLAPQEAAAAAGAAACESAEVSRRLPSAGRGIRHQSSVPGTTNPPRALLEPCPGLSPFPAYGAQPREAIPDPRAEMMSCGLLTSSKEPVPLHRSSVSVLIRGFVADVGCQLLCRNEELGPVEAVFKFPVDAEAAVDVFQARLRGAWIQAQLQEKRQLHRSCTGTRWPGAELVPAAAGGGRGRRVQLLPGEFAPGEEAMLTLSYSCKLPLEHDGAARYVLPTVLHPRYTPHGWDGENITQEVPWVLQGELPYTLSLSAMLQSPHGIDHVLSN
ncbi:unnamed protein product [Lepidochelys kempii]